MTSIPVLLGEIAENYDTRHLDLLRIARIVAHNAGTVLEPTAVQMAIPVVYAHWEGYVKEVAQLYLEFIESNATSAARLSPALLGYMWRPELRKLVGGLNRDRQESVARLALGLAQSAVGFSDMEKHVSTKSNLNYDVLEGICHDLCLDSSVLRKHRHGLNALVSLRNHIAHGQRPTALSEFDYQEQAGLVDKLMLDFESAITNAVQNGAYRLP